MSILNNFLHGTMSDLPNDVHNIDDDGTKVYLGSQSLTWSAEERKKALESKAVKPAMAYSQEELIPSDNGAWATQSTVKDQLEQREGAPQG